ncbi:restriction endonuclease subunit S [Methanobrevibacter acididurans]|uniref:restriction endonuclease subunit S n=1 Tax=Methanobrevibacter acididurans TaxID=120963 RepID=UPI0038FC78CE
MTIIKNITKYYFSSFTPFENEDFIDSELGKIPSSWEIVSLKDLVKVFNGYSYKGEDLGSSQDAMATIKNFDRNGGFKLDGFKEINISDRVKPHHYVELYDVLIACTDLTQNADIVGNAEMLLNKSGYNNILISMDLVKVKSLKPEINNYLLNSLLNTERFKNHALGYVNGTTVLHLDKKAITNYKIALPKDLSICEKVGNLLKPFYIQIANNIQENKNLEQLRDTLLPKLMSGEIDVSKIEI